MITVTPEYLTALEAASNQPLDVYELQLDSGTLFLSTEAITWGGNVYQPWVTGRSSVRRHIGQQFDGMTLTISNVDTNAAQAFLAEEIEGRKFTARKIMRDVTNDSLVIFSGVMKRISKIDERDIVIEAAQLLGSIQHEIPARHFQSTCPWLFKGTECGYAGLELECDRSWSRCSELLNTERFGGFRFVPHSGTFAYEETVRKRFLLFFSRNKKVRRAAAYTSVDDTPADTPLAVCYGRTELAGIVIQHVDTGTETKALVAWSIGPIVDVKDLRIGSGLVADNLTHIGQIGGVGTQTVDPRFPQSYEYNLVAYSGITIESDAQVADAAPNLVAVVQGQQVRHFDALGVFTVFQWTDNPVWNVRDLMLLPIHQGGMGIPNEEFDDVVNFATSAYCDELISNTTNDQKIFLPDGGLPDGLVQGVTYKRYRSTGVDGLAPLVDGPYSTFQVGVDDDTSRTPTPVNMRRFTLNGAVVSQEPGVDVLYEKMFPAFRGYLTFSKAGKIQIRCERPNPNTVYTSAAIAGATDHLCSDPAQFAVGDLVLLGPHTVNAEVLKADQVLGDRIVTVPCAFPHAIGEELLQVSMAFTDSNTVGKIEYPLSGRQSSVNRVTVKYIDAPNGFTADEPLRINDFDNQGETSRINNEDVDGSMIDSYFQAWRIGQWRLARNRSLGRFINLRADIKASLLEIGDVVAASTSEHGLQAVPFRVEELTYLETDELEITARLYLTGVYDDTAPQTTVKVPGVFSGGLQAADVTGFAASEDPAIQPDGTVLSRVTVSYTEPARGSFAAVKIYGQNLDTTETNGSGNPTEAWRLITTIDKGAGAAARILPLMAVTGLAMRLAAVSCWAEGQNPIAGSPQAEVLLDGKQSAPAPLSGLHCQIVTMGLVLGWDESPEPDAYRHLMYHTGDQVPFALKQEHRIAAIPAGRGVSAGRQRFEYRQVVYAGTSNGTTVTLPGTPFKVDQLLVETAAAVFSGVSFRFLGSGSVHSVVSNTESVVTFAAASIPVGEIEMVFAGEQQLHVSAEDTSGNESASATFPACVPYAPDGTPDEDVPDPEGSASVGNFGCWWRTGILSGKPGYLLIWGSAKGEDETETDFALAKRRNIYGIAEYEVEVTYSTDGNPLNSQLHYQTFQASNAEENYLQDLVIPPVRWLHWQYLGEVALDNRAIHGVRIRPRNSWGWGDFIAAFGFALPPGAIQWTGFADQSEEELETPDVLDKVFPNLAKSAQSVVRAPAADVEVAAAEFRGADTTPGLGGPPNQGTEFTLTLEQDGSGGRRITWGPLFKGVSDTSYPADPRPNRYTTWRFKVRSGDYLCIGHHSGSLV